MNEFEKDKDYNKKSALIIWFSLTVLSVLMMLVFFPDTGLSKALKRMSFGSGELWVFIIVSAIALLAGVAGKSILCLSLSVGNFLGLLLGYTLGKQMDHGALEAWKAGLSDEAVPYQLYHMEVWLITIAIAIVVLLVVKIMTHQKTNKI